MADPSSNIEITSGSPTGRIRLHTGRSTKITFKIPRFYYQEKDGSGIETIDEGQLHLVDPLGAVKSFPMQPGGRCPTAEPVLQWGTGYKLFITDEPCNQQEMQYLQAACREVPIATKVCIPAPECFEYHWEIDASDPEARDDVLTLEACDGSYLVREPFDATRHKKGSSVCYRFYGVKPGVLYNLTWDTGEEKLKIFEKQALELGD